MQIELESLRPLLELALDRSAPEVELDTHLYTESGMDSMGAVALVVEIQRELHIRLPEEEIPNLHTPRHYIEAILRQARGQDMTPHRTNETLSEQALESAG